VTDTPIELEGEGPWAKLRRRKVVQWGIVYATGAWGLLQGLGFAADAFAWPSAIKQVALLLLLIGLPIVLVLAWYHGDRGEQSVGRTELTIITLLFLVGGGIFWRYERASVTPPAATPQTAVPASAATSADAGPSIAVLPFENRSDEHKDAFFVDGIHDDILTQLSKISALKVISRTSVEQFRDTKLTTKAIAEQLGVRSVLEGGVQRAGTRVRINVQLIDAGTDAHLWAETYDRELTAENIFAIQTELAAAIAGALKAALTPAEKARASVVPTRNLEAWEAYQLGRQRLAKRTSGGLTEAEKFFRKAIELDPSFALAHAGLADSLTLRTAYGDTPFLATLEQAQAAADTAMRLDPGLSEAWASSGYIASSRQQSDRAEQLYRRAIELNPNNAEAVKWYGGLLLDTGRIDEGQRALERAASLDPLSAIIQLSLGGALQSRGRFAEAASRCRRAIEIDPSMAAAYSTLGYVMAYSFNRFPDAVPLAQKAAELDPGSPGLSASLAQLYFDLGDDSMLFATIEQAARRFPDDTQTHLWLAVVDLLRRDHAGAVRHAERSLALYPRNSFVLGLLRNAGLASGRAEDALARYQKAHPELFVPGAPRMDGSNALAAVDLALVLQTRGDVARAKVLLDGASQFVGKFPRLLTGIMDVRIHALRGEKAKALAVLREAEKVGWRQDWRYHRDFDPALASIRGDPEFKAVFADIERDMARQRTELAKRPKDTPLDLATVH
jgi:TolB-like protein/Flp pilus assembly protein TadD